MEKMKTNNFKYVVSIETNVHALNEDRDWEDPLSFNCETIEFSDGNLLIAREKALKKAEYFAEYFAEQPDPIYPTRKWNTIEDGDKNFFLLYQIQVFLTGENEDLCIYDDGDGIDRLDDDEFSPQRKFENLLKEYEIFKKLGIETSQYEESVQFKDWKKVLNWEKKPDWEKIGKTEGKILPNGMDWSNAQINLEALSTSQEEWKEMFDILEDNNQNTPKKESVQKFLQNKINKKIEYKTTSIHRIKINLDNIEISVKTTSEIPKEIQNELISLIDKWKHL